MDDVGPGGEIRDEWQRWPTAGREAQHRAHIKAWGEKKEQWSGSGKHVKDTEIRYAIPKIGDELGMSYASFVDRITFRSVPMARKMIRGNRYRQVSELRNEVEIMEKLNHFHIVMLIGSYTSTLKQNTLYLLLYPAATCDLKTFLHDIEDIRQGNFVHLAGIAKRFESLGFKEVLPKSQITTQSQSIDSSDISWHEPLKYLRSILGCITEAVVYVYEKNVRHLDLKPGNILLTPKRAYLADFGISRNLEDASNSLTEGYAGGTRMFQAPEALEKRLHHMSPAEIYSLGAVFLAIATVLYGENQSQFDSIMKEFEPTLKASRITGFLSRLKKVAYSDDRRLNDSQSCYQKSLIDLIESMLEYEPEKRPTAVETSHALVELGGQNQIYHEECCRKNVEQISSLRGSVIKSLQTKGVSQARRIFDLQSKLNERDIKIQSLEKEGDAKAQELDIVRNAFESRLETEKTTIARSWSRHLEKDHENSKKELESARGRIKKFEEEARVLKASKKKRGEKDRGGASTPSRLPVFRNSTSPLTPQKTFTSSTKSTNAKSENDLTALKLRTPPKHQGNNDSDDEGLMAVSGMTLVGSVSSISQHSSSPPPSPSLSKSANLKVPKVNSNGKDASGTKIPSHSSKSYAEMLRPTILPVKNGTEKGAVNHMIPLSRKTPLTWRERAAAALEKT